MALFYDNIADLVSTTQDYLIKKGAFVDLQTDLQNHVAVRELWEKRAKKFAGGLDWSFDVQIDHNHSAKFVGLYQTDGSEVHDTMTQGEVGPRFLNAHYIFDEREKALQRGGVARVEFVYSKYVSMIVSWFELLEEALWSKPTDSSDTETPYGIPYYVVKDSTTGFNGTNPSGFTSGAAGIDSSTYTRWANFTAQYTDVSKTDLLRKMRKAHRETQFRSPISHKNPDLGSMENGIFTNTDVIGLLEELVEEQNMNLGNDLASKDGRAVFKSTPLTYAPYLDDDSTDPVYMLDFQTLRLGVLPGWKKKVSKPYMVPNKHNTYRVDMDSALNLACTNRRRQTVISK